MVEACEELYGLSSGAVEKSLLLVVLEAHLDEKFIATNVPYNFCCCLLEKR